MGKKILSLFFICTFNTILIPLSVNAELTSKASSFDSDACVGSGGRPVNNDCDCFTESNKQSGHTLLLNGQCVSAEIQSFPKARFDDLKRSCNENKEYAEDKCNYLKNSKMTETMSVANMLGIGLGTQTSTNNAMACTKFAELAVLANAALAGFNTTCKYYKNSCEESCGELKDFIEHSCNSPACKAAYGIGDTELAMVKDAQKLCKSKDRILEAAMANIGVIMATAQNAKDCKKDSSSTTGVDAPVNCSDPAQAAKSAICLCQKNPRDPACLAAMKAGGGYDPYAGLNGGMGGAGSNGGFGNSNTQRDFTGTDQNKLGGGFGDMFSGGPGDYPVDPSQMGQNSAAGVNAAGGTGGRGIPGSGNPGQGGPGDEGPGNGSKYNSDIMSTARGGRGGAPGSGSSGSSSGDDRGRAYGALPGQPNAVNLKAFLPGNKYDPRRQIANSGGPDGITGPHTNIWTKINNRYNAQRMSLMP